MKLKNLILFMSAGAFALGMSSCENSDISFPDSDAGVQVYFAYQHPIRTIVLGDLAAYDNTRENVDHAFTIYGVSSGSYSGKDIDVEVAVDETLLKGLTFEDGTPVQLMPSNYYQLSGSTLHYGGNFRGGVDVTLSDEFFKDPASVGNTYVIPMVMKSASGEVDGILKGTASQDGALRQDETKWMVAPKDYTLFLVNYINKYEANYLRRGTDLISNYPRKADSNPIEIDGGATTTGNNYDNQFFITFDSHKIVPGDKWSLTMKVKAEQPASIGTQIHRAPGDYCHWDAIGNIDFTSEWTDYEKSGTFNDAGQYGSPEGGYSIALNLNDFADANKYYFDNIELKINDEVVVKPGVIGSYSIKTNIGPQAEDIITSDYWVYDEANAIAENNVRHKEFVEKDEVIKATTKSLNEVILPITGLMREGTPVACDLLLTFDADDNCTISSATDGYTATGTGSFKSKSELKAWGNKDRDALYLNYTIDLGANKYQSSDTLVVRDRGNVTQIREFKTTYNEEE